MSESKIELLLSKVWSKEQDLTSIYQPIIDDNDVPIQIAEGLGYTASMQSEDGDDFSWDEQRLVVRSFKHAKKQEHTLQSHVMETQAAIAKLNQRGRDIKFLDEKELQAAVANILQKHRVHDLLQIEYREEKKETLKKTTRK